MSTEHLSAHDAVKARIRAVGLRCTAARLTVLQHLIAAHGPQTHAEVSDALVERGFDRATIYRNLTELTQAKLLTRMELGDHVWRFELRRPNPAGSSEAHPHFLCTTCGVVSCLEDVTVAITPKPKAAKPSVIGRAKTGTAKPRSIRFVTEVLLKGQCGNCK
ncbi:MAG: transcriptional repressor [Planctomycetota bacterium]|nr:MAG: transcriptional repressor [Planctomycetota bacterium]